MRDESSAQGPRRPRDLHCSNICLAEHGPVIYDCWSSTIAPAAGFAREIAFLSRTLPPRAGAYAERSISQYLAVTDDSEAGSLCPCSPSLCHGAGQGDAAPLHPMIASAAGGQTATFRFARSGHALCADPDVRPPRSGKSSWPRTGRPRIEHVGPERCRSKELLVWPRRSTGMVHWTRGLTPRSRRSGPTPLSWSKPVPPCAACAGHHRCGVPAPVAAGGIVDAARQAHVPLIVVHVTAETLSSANDCGSARTMRRKCPMPAWRCTFGPGQPSRPRLNCRRSRWLWFGLDDRSRRRSGR